MKAVIIHGQSHKQSSYHIGHVFLSQLKQVEVKEYFMPQDMSHFCRGCYRCMQEDISYCPDYEEMKPIIEAIEEASLLIFTTPVYGLHASGSMKAFLDHCFTMWMPHRPQQEMFSKKAVILVSGAGSGMKSAAKDIKDALKYWGISDIYIYGQRSMAVTYEQVPQEVKKKMIIKMSALATRVQKKKSHVSIMTKMRFMMMRMMQKKGWGSCERDTNYWRDKGWLGSKRPWN